MALQQKNPTSPGTRFHIRDDYSDLTKFSPEKSLLAPLHQKAGRDWRGFVSVRHRGGGNKKHYLYLSYKNGFCFGA